MQQREESIMSSGTGLLKDVVPLAGKGALEGRAGPGRFCGNHMKMKTKRFQTFSLIRCNHFLLCIEPNFCSYYHDFHIFKIFDLFTPPLASLYCRLSRF